jgi:hypothetical protein
MRIAIGASIAPSADHHSAPATERDRVACAPVRYGSAERRRFSRCPVLLLEPVEESAHSVLPCVGWDRTDAVSLARSERRRHGLTVSPMHLCELNSVGIAKRTKRRPVLVSHRVADNHTFEGVGDVYVELFLSIPPK